VSRGARCLITALVLAQGADARAQERPRIVVLDDGGQAVLAERIRAELNTMGFDAAVATLPRGEETLARLVALTREQGAVAAIRVVMAADGAEALLFDRTTGKRLARSIPGGSGQEARLALLAVELLRASLLELGLPEAPPGDVAASPALLKAARVPPRTPPAARPAAPEPARPIVAVEAGVGALASRGGLPSIAALAISASALAGPALRIGLLAVVPVGAMTTRAPEGSSETRVAIAGVEIRRQTLGHGWHTAVGGGAALSVFTTEGRGAAPLYRDSNATRLSGGPYLRAGVDYDVTTRFALRVDAAAGAQLRPFALDYAGREVARWGQPWLAGWAAAEVRFR
jgi:hypothetical protein